MDAPAFVRLDDRAAGLTLRVNGTQAFAAEGDTLAAVLLASGWLDFGLAAPGQAPSGPLCLMGSCYQCLVRVDGGAPVRACRT